MYGKDTNAMKNLLNCHTIGLHSFPLSFENGLYKRIFYADVNHNMDKPIEIAIHPHHVDIKITVLDGELFNLLYMVDKDGEPMNKFQWVSHILNGNGGFEYLGEERLKLLSCKGYAIGDTFTLKACELHTVQVEKGNKCVWLVEETVPTCEYFPINYSPYDLSQWNADGLYLEVDDSVKEKYIGKYLEMSIISITFTF